VVLAFLAVLGLSLASFLLLSWKSPHGEWDALVIWNLRARFLHRGGEHWSDGFTEALGWTHPDYPLLLPATVARGWTYLGREHTLVPAGVALLFTLATAGLLVSAVGRCRGPTQGLLAGGVLLATSSFVMQGTAQMADAPLGFFILAVTVLFCIRERECPDNGRLSVLAGTLAGLAAWTKNEGILFLVVTLVARGVGAARAGGWKRLSRDVPAFAVGLLPVAAVLLAFKVYLAPANDLVAGQGPGATAVRLADGSRYAQVGAAWVAELARLGPGAVPLLALYGLLVGRATSGRRRGLGHTLLVLGGMAGGYTAVYLITPQDLTWHLKTSLERLLLQLWPTGLFAFFLAVATPQEARSARERPVPSGQDVR
jgi:4-amino-4-deoxy-L-arabinose transferase-like glycosyltransferase